MTTKIVVHFGLERIVACARSLKLAKEFCFKLHVEAITLIINLLMFRRRVVTWFFDVNLRAHDNNFL